MRARAKRGRVERTIALARVLGGSPPAVDLLRYPPHPYATPAPLQACPPTGYKTGSSRGPRPIECRNGDRQPRSVHGRRRGRGKAAVSLEPSSCHPGAREAGEAADVERGTAPELDSSDSCTAPSLEDSTAPDSSGQLQPSRSSDGPGAREAQQLRSSRSSSRRARRRSPGARAAAATYRRP